MKWLSGLILSLSLTSALGQVYKWVDSDGIVHYSDEPEAGARPITLPEISIYKFRVPDASRAAVEEKTPSVPLVEDYRRFEISSPGNNESFHGVPARLDVVLDIDPALQTGHTIELSLDGRAEAAQVSKGTATIAGFAAGSHILSARIIAADGRQLDSTKSVLFHYQPSESTSVGDAVPSMSAHPPGDPPLP